MQTDWKGVTDDKKSIYIKLFTGVTFQFWEPNEQNGVTKMLLLIYELSVLKKMIQIKEKQNFDFLPEFLFLGCYTVLQLNNKRNSCDMHKYFLIYSSSVISYNKYLKNKLL